MVVVKSVSKTYSQGLVETRALDNLSLTIKDDEFLIIVGRNGSGKSTLLRQIGLLDHPDQGEITFEDTKVTGISENERSEFRLRKMGYVFQEYALVSDLTALENVMLPAMMLDTARNARIKAEKLIEMVGVSHRKNNLPSQLSGGEQQKVAIARALVNNPELIIADEPTANLDSTSAGEIINIFKHLNQDGHTIVMVTHEEEEEKIASRIVRLSDGRIV